MKPSRRIEARPRIRNRVKGKRQREKITKDLACFECRRALRPCSLFCNACMQVSHSTPSLGAEENTIEGLLVHSRWTSCSLPAKAAAIMLGNNQPPHPVVSTPSSPQKEAQPCVGRRMMRSTLPVRKYLRGDVSVKSETGRASARVKDRKRRKNL